MVENVYMKCEQTMYRMQVGPLVCPLSSADFRSTFFPWKNEWMNGFLNTYTRLSKLYKLLHILILKGIGFLACTRTRGEKVRAEGKFVTRPPLEQNMQDKYARAKRANKFSFFIEFYARTSLKDSWNVKRTLVSQDWEQVCKSFEESQEILYKY